MSLNFAGFDNWGIEIDKSPSFMQTPDTETLFVRFRTNDAVTSSSGIFNLFQFTDSGASITTAATDMFWSLDYFGDNGGRNVTLRWIDSVDATKSLLFLNTDLTDDQSFEADTNYMMVIRYDENAGAAGEVNLRLYKEGVSGPIGDKTTATNGMKAFPVDGKIFIGCAAPTGIGNFQSHPGVLYKLDALTTIVSDSALDTYWDSLHLADVLLENFSTLGFSLLHSQDGMLNVQDRDDASTSVGKVSAWFVGDTATNQGYLASEYDVAIGGSTTLGGGDVTEAAWAEAISPFDTGEDWGQYYQPKTLADAGLLAEITPVGGVLPEFKKFLQGGRSGTRPLTAWTTGNSRWTRSQITPANRSTGPLVSESQGVALLQRLSGQKQGGLITSSLNASVEELYESSITGTVERDSTTNFSRLGFGTNFAKTTTIGNGDTLRLATSATEFIRFAIPTEHVDKDTEVIAVLLKVPQAASCTLTANHHTSLTDGVAAGTDVGGTEESFDLETTVLTTTQVSASGLDIVLASDTGMARSYAICPPGVTGVDFPINFISEWDNGTDTISLLFDWSDASDIPADTNTLRIGPWDYEVVVKTIPAGSGQIRGFKYEGDTGISRIVAAGYRVVGEPNAFCPIIGGRSGNGHTTQGLLQFPGAHEKFLNAVDKAIGFDVVIAGIASQDTAAVSQEGLLQLIGQMAGRKEVVATPDISALGTTNFSATTFEDHHLTRQSAAQDYPNWAYFSVVEQSPVSLDQIAAGFRADTSHQSGTGNAHMTDLWWDQISTTLGPLLTESDGSQKARHRGVRL